VLYFFEWHTVHDFVSRCKTLMPGPKIYNDIKLLATSICFPKDVCALFFLEKLEGLDRFFSLMGVSYRKLFFWNIMAPFLIHGGVGLRIWFDIKCLLTYVWITC